jgi:hypothetical protein
MLQIVVGDFKIWTEKNLADMGILPKPQKPLTKIKPLRPLRIKKK